MEDDGQREAHERGITRTWRAWRTAHEMVADRGYELGEHEINMSLDTFRTKFVNEEGGLARSLLKFSARPGEELTRRSIPPATPANPEPKPTAGTIYVEFLDDNTLGTEQMRRFGKWCADNHHTNGIIISNVAVSSAAKKEIPKFKDWTAIEWFLEDDLLINITHHDLVPRHVVLSREEKTALLKRYRLKETQLPRILMRDPVAKYYGMTRGQVVKIIRKSETAGRYASYRLCV
ncbi:RNA polymerase Rpb5, C-terminal domain-containing protein [Truncatella angustata]|uniref:DNA-directed RNA polymerases I, II, and III subunit RPABC1 n=1 Tax=Truncatella angustata TaxID=152316 RepID=A0A9P8UXL8_9PEZI|nr:RNA polymerase Rpb5, C-terminal domain-containing protein [Truncatella angustata]KAH6659804.1 RNA polymerase Rpb5, C-terminal domain-containing protein [Truncatella angustata]